jgi:hypothetical protein
MVDHSSYQNPFLSHREAMVLDMMLSKALPKKKGIG